jgi:hypothetical protein
MMRTKKSWVFWLGLIILAMATVHILTGTYYRPLNDVGFIVHINTSSAVTGFAFFLAGLYIMYSGRNKPGSPTETILF